MRNRIIYAAIATVLILLLLGGALTLWSQEGILGQKKYVLSEEQYQDWQKFQRLEQIKDIIESKYYKPIEDEDTLYEGAYKGMVEALNDPYSNYVDEQQYQELMDYSSGTFSGIGAVLQQGKEDESIVVVRLINDSPAQKAGMLAGDIFLEVDGVSIQGQIMDEVVSKVKGENGTMVKIKVLRGNEEIVFDIKRAEVHEPVVSYEMLDNDIAYVYLSQFSGGAAREFADTLKTIKKQGAKGFVVDMRFNPGGILTECVEICDFLLPKGRVVYEKDRDGVTKTYDSGASKFGLPFVVLVNEYSASAAEIAAGAIQAAGEAPIIGTATYGKGVVQHYYNLDEKTSVKLTASVYYLDNDQTPQEVGITPDVEIDLPQELIDQGGLISREQDTQFQKALEVLKEKMGK